CGKSTLLRALARLLRPRRGSVLLDGHAISKAPEGVKPRGLPTVPPDQLKGHVISEVLYDNDGNEVQPLPLDLRQVTSILVLCNNPFGSTAILTSINKDSTSAIQAIAPTSVVEKLLSEFVGPIRTILLVLTILIVVVASISILVSIYNSMSERSHDLAVIRALGANRMAVMLIVLFESILLSVTGGVVGILIGHLLIGGAAPYVVENTGVRLGAWEFDQLELLLIPALVVLATLAGLLPAVAAYRTDVARSLTGAR
ncbi:MAG: FtsX-like permease family protein, partial [Planctomycetales bacterium]|nr:FtsX-like permease family protein [Planctomycetales bacterium]